jgi:tetratricopeptide (TPR) repeat protein
LLLAALVVGQGAQVPAAEQRAAAPALKINVELAKARELLEELKLDEAEGLVRKYIEQHPGDSDGYCLLGLTLFRRVQSIARSNGVFLAPGEAPSAAIDSKKRDTTIRESLAAYTEGAKYGKPSADDLKIVSLDFVLLGDYTSADKWLSLALEWNPADADGWYYLGRTKYNENRFDEAIQAFQKCLALRPRYTLAANGVGLSYEGLNRIADALSWYQNAISWQESSEKKSPEPYVDLGDLLAQQARFEEAVPV